MRLARIQRLTLEDYAVAAAFTPGARQLLVAGGEGGIWRLDWQSGQTAAALGHHAGGALALCAERAGMRFASSGADGELRLWDARDGSHQVLHRSPEWTTQLAFSSNGKRLAAATGRQLRVYDGASAEPVPLPLQSSVIAALAWRPRSEEIAAAGNGGIWLHRLGTPPLTRELAWPGACLTVCWNADGRIVASGLQDGSVHFWNVAAGTQSQMRGYGAKVSLTSWLSGGRYLVTAADTNLVLWDFSGRGPEGREPLQLAAHTARVTQLACQPQGPLLASAARDRRLLLWQPLAGSEPLDADLADAEIALLAWSPDGELLLMADAAGQLRIYQCRSS